MKSISFALFTLLFSLSLQAEEYGGEEKAVRQTIQYYLEGYSQGNADKLKMAFRQDVVIKYINPWRAKYAEFTMPELNNFANNLPKNWDVAAKIDFVDVQGTAAAAKLTIVVKGSVTWTDYLHLLKIEDKWWIIGKISYGDRKSK